MQACPSARSFSSGTQGITKTKPPDKHVWRPAFSMVPPARFERATPALGERDDINSMSYVFSYCLLSSLFFGWSCFKILFANSSPKGSSSPILRRLHAPVLNILAKQETSSPIPQGSGCRHYSCKTKLAVMRDYVEFGATNQEAMPK